MWIRHTGTIGEVGGGDAFIAIPNITTQAEILSAYESGKSIMLGIYRSSDLIGYITVENIKVEYLHVGSDTVAFVYLFFADYMNEDNPPLSSCYFVGANNTWSRTELTLPYWKPNVDAAGNLTWTLTDDTTAPASQNIMGPAGGAGPEDIVDGQWTIKKYPDGTYEAWYTYWDLEYTIDIQEGAIFRSDDIVLSFPASLNPQNKKNSVHFGGVMVRNPNFDCWGAYNGQSHMACAFKIYSAQARAANNRFIVNIYIKGKIG